MRRFAGVVILVLSTGTLACGAKTAPPVVARPASRHLEIVRAMSTGDRRALVTRFEERNPPDPRLGRWTINEEALARSVMVVDPFKGFLRRAERRRPVEPPLTAPPPADEELAVVARAFVQRNADLLGLGSVVAMTLTEEVLPAPPRAGHPAEPPRWIVRFRTSFPSRGYESFPMLDNEVDLDVVLDAERSITALVNRSAIHPRLTLDLRPDLASDDRRVVAKLFGRRGFVLVDNPGEAVRDVRKLQRIELGPSGPEDVTQARLIIHVSPGPRLAWLAYRLAYLVDVAKPRGGPPTDPLDPSTAYFFFRYVVDADTGDVVEDSGAPMVLPP